MSFRSPYPDGGTGARHVEFIESIPKSPSGKILRRVLVERERASQRSAPLPT
jgi:acyl-CoA synthetase (AMP-forming)/AMP-acid ligase II